MRLSATLIAATAVLAACESESTLPENENPGTTNQVTVNASSSTAFKYFSLATGQEVTVANPAASDAWDIAVRRYEVRLNGGVAGTKGVRAALVVDNSTEPSATLLGYTAESRLPSFNAVLQASLPAANLFATTDLAEDLSGWFRAQGASLVANPAKVWKVKRAGGGHALVRVAEIALTGQTLSSFRLEYRLQPAAGVLGAVQSLTVVPGAPGAPTKISLGTGGAVVTEGCTWDLAISSALVFTVNPGAACGAGTYPAESTEGFADLTTAADAPAYGAFVAALSGPIANSVSASAHPPFIYNIDPANPNRLTPTFNVYAVKVGGSTYKLQFVNYYNPAGGESGYLTFRYARIQ